MPVIVNTDYINKFINMSLNKYMIYCDVSKNLINYSKVSDDRAPNRAVVFMYYLPIRQFTSQNLTTNVTHVKRALQRK